MVFDMSLCSISHLSWHICSLRIIDATVLSSPWSVPFQLQVSLIRSSEYALGFLDLSQGLRVLRGIPDYVRQLTEFLSQVLAVTTSRKPSSVETLGFLAIIPLLFFAERIVNAFNTLTGALQLTSLRRGEVPKVSITWDTLAPRRWWHEETSRVESGTLEVCMLPIHGCLQCASWSLALLQPDQSHGAARKEVL